MNKLKKSAKYYTMRLASAPSGGLNFYHGSRWPSIEEYFVLSRKEMCLINNNDEQEKHKIIIKFL